jgi:DNA-binding NtrC family response regulator
MADDQQTSVTQPLRVLVAEDDTSARAGLVELIAEWGFEVRGACDGDDALAQIAHTPPDIVLVDLVMPKRDGLAVLEALTDRLQDMTFVMMTAQGTVESAVTALKDGAHDYLSKPIDPRQLRLLLDKIAERHDTLRQVKALKRQLHTDGRFGRTVGVSPQIREVFALVEQAAPSDASVLICGESGTGKELMARTIHELSARAAAPFFAMNCAAIPESLLESEVFGHERGAFTGAVDRRPGCFELAHHGTLFLDEIAEMDPSVQAKLLRALQERTVRRLGGKSEIPVDVRLIAATNVDPHEAIAENQLREDLFYRINVITITLPPLRERRADIPLLAQAFVAECADHEGKAVRGVDAEAIRILERYPWPGNIRELRNVIERAVILAQGELITANELPPDLVHGPVPPVRGSLGLTPGTRLRDAERRLIEVTLEHAGQNKTRAAELLGVSVRTLHNKLHKFEAEDAREGGTPAPGG